MEAGAGAAYTYSIGQFFLVSTDFSFEVLQRLDQLRLHAEQLLRFGAGENVFTLNVRQFALDFLHRAIESLAVEQDSVRSPLFDLRKKIQASDI